jgi:hypothetical protein
MGLKALYHGACGPERDSLVGCLLLLLVG